MWEFRNEVTPYTTTAYTALPVMENEVKGTPEFGIWWHREGNLV